MEPKQSSLMNIIATQTHQGEESVEDDSNSRLLSHLRNNEFKMLTSQKKQQQTSQCWKIVGLHWAQIVMSSKAFQNKAHKDTLYL